MTELTDVVPATAAAEPTPPSLVQKLLAEFLGTFVLVLFGCGVAVMTDADIVATGLAFGLTVTLMAYAVGRISGGHFNPAVSIGAAIGGRVSWKDALTFIGAQFVGGIVAALVLMILALGIDGFEAFDSNFALGANGYSEGPFDYAVWAALLVELIMTFLFVLVILAVTDERNAVNVVMAPLAIGVTLAVIHFMLIPLTGTSVNPARSLGPALFSGGDWILQVWPFLIAPTVGGALAGLVYPLAFGRGAEPVPGSGFGGGRIRPNPFEQQWNQPQGAGFGQPGGGFGQPQQEQPIIQDGWQWEPNSQQWIPAQQPGPGAPGGHAAPAPDPQTPQQGDQGGWGPPAGDQTVVRPPQ